MCAGSTGSSCSDDCGPAGQPQVGIFWSVPAEGGSHVLVTDRTPLARAEPYGDALTHPRGHYEVWEGWRALGVTGLRAAGLPTAIAHHEYEEFPRGRVVYHRSTSLFTIYADRRLQHPARIAQLVALFGLGGWRHVVRSDAHYQSWT